jgi:hypothetical protein
MTSSTSTAWNTGTPSQRCGRPPRRTLEIVGIVVAFVWFWPVALAYVVWKMMGYPKADRLRGHFQDAFGRFEQAFKGSGRGFGGGFGPGSTGNAAFDEYRRKEFDAFMAKRRADQSGPTTSV